MLILIVSAFHADRIGMANTRQRQILSCKPRFCRVTFAPRAWEPSLRKESGRAGPPFSSLYFLARAQLRVCHLPRILSRWESLTLAVFSSAPVKSSLASDTEFARHVKAGERVEFSRKILRQNELRKKSGRAQGETAGEERKTET